MNSSFIKTSSKMLLGAYRDIKTEKEREREREKERDIDRER